VIITGIVVYTVHLPKPAAEPSIANCKQSPATRQPVTLLSVSYQNGGSVRVATDVVAQNISHETDNSCADQLMSRHDLPSSLADV